MSRTKILELTRKVVITNVLISIGIASVLAQAKSSATLLEFRYGVHFPAGDMKDRFGFNNDVGAGILLVNSRSALFAGADGIFIFGNTIKEDVLAGLRGFDGSIIGINGGPADVNLKERGFYLGLNAGKIFRVTKRENDLTGIKAQIGAGLLQHKIRVQDNSKSVIALDKPYRKGYDRLTNGPAVHFALGFQYYHPESNFRVNLMGDFYAAKTKSRRDFDFPTGGYLEGKRTDILSGFTLAYIVYISRSSDPGEIYY